MFQTKQKTLFSLIGFVAILLTAAPLCLAGVDAAPYLRLGAGARSLGMGGAFTAVADDATATIWNPAGLPAVKDLTFTVFATRLPAEFDSKHNFVGVAKKLNHQKGTLGFALINVGVDDIIGYDAAGKKTGGFGYSSNAFSLSYGHAIQKVNIGASVRLLRDGFDLKGIDNKTGFGGVDVGLLGRGYSDTVSYGLAVRNLGGKIAESNIPILLDGGLAFKLLRKHAATFAFDVEHEFVDLAENTTSVRVGAEYLIANVFAIRGGARATRDRRSWFGGFGVTVAGLQVDYALKLSDDTTRSLGDGNTHFISLSYSY
jgi:hypothetical protein